jgi:prepilin-type processing-associated H-X9-DG protein
LHHDVEAPIDANNNGVFFLNSQVDYDQITDGTAHTIFIGEKILEREPNLDLGWMSGTRASLRNTGRAINADKQPAGRAPSPVVAASDPLTVGGFGSHHPGGASFAFGDGHVGFMAQSVSDSVYQQYGHRSDGKLLKDRAD